MTVILSLESTPAWSRHQKTPCRDLAGNSHHCLVDGNIFSNSGDGVLCLAGARHNQISGNVYDNPGLVNRRVTMQSIQHVSGPYADPRSVPILDRLCSNQWSFCYATWSLTARPARVLHLARVKTTCVD